MTDPLHSSVPLILDELWLCVRPEAKASMLLIGVDEVDVLHVLKNGFGPTARPSGGVADIFGWLLDGGAISVTVKFEGQSSVKVLSCQRFE